MNYVHAAKIDMKSTREKQLEKALNDACDALLMLSITGSNELPGVSWDDLETEIPISIEQLQDVIKIRKSEAYEAWKKAYEVLKAKS